MRFIAQHADYAFVIGDISGDAVFAANRKLQEYAEEQAATSAPTSSTHAVLGETEAEARAKLDYWVAHADRDALATMMGQAVLDAVGGTAAALQGMAYIGITPRRSLRHTRSAPRDSTRIGAVPGTKGIMLIFPECLEGLQGARRAGADAHVHGQAGSPTAFAGVALKKDSRGAGGWGVTYSPSGIPRRCAGGANGSVVVPSGRPVVWEW